jgi:hypothetical protein
MEVAVDRTQVNPAAALYPPIDLGCVQRLLRIERRQDRLALPG